MKLAATTAVSITTVSVNRRLSNVSLPLTVLPFFLIIKLGRKLSGFWIKEKQLLL